jgi:hypothetical protein
MLFSLILNHFLVITKLNVIINWTQSSLLPLRFRSEAWQALIIIHNWAVFGMETSLSSFGATERPWSDIGVDVSIIYKLVRISESWVRKSWLRLIIVSWRFIFKFWIHICFICWQFILSVFIIIYFLNLGQFRILPSFPWKSLTKCLISEIGKHSAHARLGPSAIIDWALIREKLLLRVRNLLCLVDICSWPLSIIRSFIFKRWQHGIFMKFNFFLFL